MQADLWKKVEELFQAAMAQPPEERAEFLDQACPGDSQLRAEVQSLLDAVPGADSFLEDPPVSVASSLKPGQKIGHFEIIGAVGRGGMGEVWKARDLRLKRDVAIKVLPADLVRDPDRIARFEREARAASALNHPNIVSVHEIGNDGGVSFIVSELVDGETLARVIERGALPLRADRGRHTNLRGTRGGARGRSHPPRLETGQHHADPRRAREDPRFWARAPGSRSGSSEHDDGDQPYGRHPGHSRLHVARAGAGRIGRPPLGPVQPRRGAV